MPDPSVNGAPDGVDVEAMLDDDFDAKLAAELRGKIAQIDGQLAGLHTLVERKKRYEGLLGRLTGENRKLGRPPGPHPAAKPSAQTPGTRVGPERLAEIERMVRDYAADHEEFRQVDVRSTFGHFADGATITSSITSGALEQLRQANVVRVARIDGNSKVYRLTREALAKR